MSNREDAWQVLRIQRKSLWRGFFVILFMAGLYFLWQYMGEKATGVVYQTKSETLSSDKSQDIRLYKGKYVSFSYKGAYQESAHTVNGDLIKESILLVTSNYEGRSIVVMVAARGTDDLSSDPSFQMRTNAPEEYKKSQFSQSKQSFSGTFFEKNTQPFERTAFFTLEGYIVSISVTSLFTSDGLETELSEILSSLQFTQRQ